MASGHTTHDAARDISPTAHNLPADHIRPADNNHTAENNRRVAHTHRAASANLPSQSAPSATPPRANQATPSTTTPSAMAAPTHRPAPRPAARRLRAKVPAGAQVHGTGQSVVPVALSGVSSGVSLPGVSAPPVAAHSVVASPLGSPSAPMHVPTQATPAVVPFQPRALLAPAREPWPHDPLPVVQEQPAEPPADAPQDTATPQPETPDTEATETDADALMQDLGLEPAPGTPEALALLAEAGVAPKPGPGEPLGPDDERFSPIAIGHLTHRLVEVKRLLEQLNAEQKTLHETLRLAHLRGDLLHLLAPSTEGWCYQLQDGTLLSRRQGRKQWAYSSHWAEMEAQLKARQTYEQATGQATWRHGAAFWELRGQKG